MLVIFRTLLLPIWPAICLSAACSLAAISANVGLMATSAYLLSLAALQPPLAALSTAIVGVRFFGLSRAFFRYLERYSGHDAALQLLASLRVRFFRSLEPLTATELNQYAAADLFSRMVADVETLKFLPVRLIIPLLVALVSLFAMTVLSAVLHWQLSLIVLIGVLLLGGLIPCFFYRQGQSSRQMLALRRADFNVAVVDNVRGIRDAAVFDAFSLLRQRFAAANGGLIRAAHASQATAASCDASGQFIAQATLIAGLALLVAMVERGELAGVFLAAWALLVQSSFEAFFPLAAMFRYVEEIRDSISRLIELPPPRPVAATAPIAKISPPFQLTAANISCRYSASGRLVLNQVSLRLFPGRHIAVVGPSGAGKSTLLSVLAGLQPPEQGLLKLNGNDLYQLAASQRNNCLGLVLQHDHLFHATIADNLRLARPAATDGELWQSLEQVFLADAIRKLPQQLATDLGSEGHGLSGGERRRLSLARLLLKNPPLLLLDEPTAGMDPLLSGRLLAKAGPLLRQDRAVLLVTHQWDALATMDEILVLDCGKVVERGTLPELLNQRGLFHDMWDLRQDQLDFSADIWKKTK